MAAEKLTTGRLVQILVVMTVLVTAFIWRTVDYSNTQETLKCSVVAGSCSVSINGETVEIKVENQADNSLIMLVDSVYVPGELQWLDQPEKVITSHNFFEKEDKKRVYIYALPTDVNSGSAHKWLLNIDRDQLEINF